LLVVGCWSLALLTSCTCGCSVRAISLVDRDVYHQPCFKCSVPGCCADIMKEYFVAEGKLYCQQHDPALTQALGVCRACQKEVLAHEGVSLCSSHLPCHCACVYIARTAPTHQATSSVDHPFRSTTPAIQLVGPLENKRFRCQPLLCHCDDSAHKYRRLPASS
jgi:hypothetical protein